MRKFLFIVLVITLPLVAIYFGYQAHREEKARVAFEEQMTSLSVALNKSFPARKGMDLNALRLFQAEVSKLMFAERDKERRLELERLLYDYDQRLTNIERAENDPYWIWPDEAATLPVP